MCISMTGTQLGITLLSLCLILSVSGYVYYCYVCYLKKLESEIDVDITKMEQTLYPYINTIEGTWRRVER